MVEQGFADIICSDYSPMSLLKGVFVASDRYSLPMHEVLTLFTANPALAGGSRNTGKIQEGFMGDFALVSEKKGYPEITHTFVDGVPVYQSCCSVNKAAVSCK